MQYSTFLATLVALSATSTLAMPTAVTAEVAPPPPVGGGYGYDGKPLDYSFCAQAATREKTEQCRKEVETCDKKFDNDGRESQCVKTIRAKYPKPAAPSPPVGGYGYDGKPLDASFCRLAGSQEKENQCRRDIEQCDRKFDNEGRESQCVKTVRGKYTPPNYGYDGKPLDASFCRNAGPQENQCRKDVENCDRKFDNEGRESSCVKGLRSKYSGNSQPPAYNSPNGPNPNGNFNPNGNNPNGYKSLNADFCKKVRDNKENECRIAVKECEKKHQNEDRAKDCAKGVEDKYLKNGDYSKPKDSKPPKDDKNKPKDYNPATGY